MKVILDCYGGDNSPFAQVEGAVNAVKDNKDLFVTLVGKESELTTELSKYSYNKNQIDIVNADEVISCEDKPTQAIREKKQSSLVVSYGLLKNNDEYGAMVSSGSTGAIIAGSIMKLGRIKGISRPALAPLLPTYIDGKVAMLIDSGANVDCKPINLLHFALMGSVYYKNVLGVEKPKVVILSNGTEDEKGNELSKASFELIKDLEGIDFCGNCEARDILSGKYDVIVADGFVGNTAIKASEGAIMLCLKTIKKEIKASFWAKIGYLFMGKAFSKVKNKMDYNSFGGAVVLGADKPIIKAHGSSNAVAIKASLLQAYNVCNGGITDKIKQGLEGIKNVENLWFFFVRESNRIHF